MFIVVALNLFLSFVQFVIVAVWWPEWTRRRARDRVMRFRLLCVSAVLTGVALVCGVLIAVNLPLDRNTVRMLGGCVGSVFVVAMTWRHARDLCRIRDELDDKYGSER